MSSFLLIIIVTSTLLPGSNARGGRSSVTQQGLYSPKSTSNDGNRGNGGNGRGKSHDSDISSQSIGYSSASDASTSTIHTELPNINNPLTIDRISQNLIDSSIYLYVSSIDNPLQWKQILPDTIVHQVSIACCVTCF